MDKLSAGYKHSFLASSERTIYGRLKRPTAIVSIVSQSRSSEHICSVAVYDFRNYSENNIGPCCIYVPGRTVPCIYALGQTVSCSIYVAGRTVMQVTCLISTDLNIFITSERGRKWPSSHSGVPLFGG